MSPYSSVFRSLTWGGIPIALPALGVFAFLFFRGLDLSLRRGIDRGETGFLIVAALLPVATSAIYFWISKVELGTVCTICAGIYGASLCLGSGPGHALHGAEASLSRHAHP